MELPRSCREEDFVYPLTSGESNSRGRDNGCGRDGLKHGGLEQGGWTNNDRWRATVNVIE